ncbi:Dabb family protein [Paenibacillus tritici]|uniref:Dabb family protein n=1 Tax=Paenibacillus tritici TaxID=1873425 RepID=A0ABX2DZL0_9BACL|nr:Dabb family protein [Paenibacillus tritici]NQX48921.1 Dabb family protein [Paenibacillus tritici]QUL52445.1 Dabb family protein [Paenibacillus tritici]
MNKGAIRHMAVFTLKSAPDTEETRAFLRDGAEILSAIPGVNHFEVLRQVSVKCDYQYGFSMEFADQAAYDAYNNHPDHQAFVAERWDTQVAAFQEIDFMV